MAKLRILGGRKLSGQATVHGSKNSALPILAATVLCSEQCFLHNCPALSDVCVTEEILRHLGAEVAREGDTFSVNCKNATGHNIPEALMDKMRSSIIFLGALATRFGQAELFLPGGCELGPRPIDMHLWALRKMGLTIEEEGGHLLCKADGRLKGTHIAFPIRSVGVTENLVLAAVLAEGTTLLQNCAREPEVEDLCYFLVKCGAKISGIGTSTLEIDGVRTLGGCVHTVIPDRVVAATYLAAAAVTGSEISIKHVIFEHIAAVCVVFGDMGCEIFFKNDTMNIKAPKKLSPARFVATRVFPGFPTDVQALAMAASTVATGHTVFEENIFSGRYKHAKELSKMGAKIFVDGKTARVEGVPALQAAAVFGEDLRGTAALVVAALGAKGESEVSGLSHLDRGYKDLEKQLVALGAKIETVD